MIDAKVFPYSYKCPFCNRQIFFFKEKPVSGEKVLAGNIYFENGSKPTPGDKIQCPRKQCFAMLGGLYTRFVQETEEPKKDAIS